MPDPAGCRHEDRIEIEWAEGGSWVRCSACLSVLSDTRPACARRGHQYPYKLGDAPYATCTVCGRQRETLFSAKVGETPPVLALLGGWDGVHHLTDADVDWFAEQAALCAPRDGLQPTRWWRMK